MPPHAKPGSHLVGGTRLALQCQYTTSSGPCQLLCKPLPYGSRSNQRRENCNPSRVASSAHTGWGQFYHRRSPLTTRRPLPRVALEKPLAWGQAGLASRAGAKPVSCTPLGPQRYKQHAPRQDVAQGRLHRVFCSGCSRIDRCVPTAVRRPASASRQTAPSRPTSRLLAAGPAPGIL